jgi:hypothetical protein
LFGNVTLLLVLTQHPDWSAYNGTSDYFGATALCLGHIPARDWLLRAVKHLIDTYDIDYIVQDGEDMIKKCEKSDHTHNYNDYNYANSIQGLDYVLQEIRKHKPGFILENCEDGGNSKIDSEALV